MSKPNYDFSRPSGRRAAWEHLETTRANYLKNDTPYRWIARSMIAILFLLMAVLFAYVVCSGTPNGTFGSETWANFIYKMDQLRGDTLVVWLLVSSLIVVAVPVFIGVILRLIVLLLPAPVKSPFPEGSDDIQQLNQLLSCVKQTETVASRSRSGTAGLCCCLLAIVSLGVTILGCFAEDLTFAYVVLALFLVSAVFFLWGGAMCLLMQIFVPRHPAFPTKLWVDAISSQLQFCNATKAQYEVMQNQRKGLEALYSGSYDVAHYHLNKLTGPQSPDINAARVIASYYYDPKSKSLQALTQARNALVGYTGTNPRLQPLVDETVNLMASDLKALYKERVEKATERMEEGRQALEQGYFQSAAQSLESAITLGNISEAKVLYVQAIKGGVPNAANRDNQKLLRLLHEAQRDGLSTPEMTETCRWLTEEVQSEIAELKRRPQPSRMGQINNAGFYNAPQQQVVMQQGAPYYVPPQQVVVVPAAPPAYYVPPQQMVMPQSAPGYYGAPQQQAAPAPQPAAQPYYNAPQAAAAPMPEAPRAAPVQPNAPEASPVIPASQADVRDSWASAYAAGAQNSQDSLNAIPPSQRC